MSEEPSLIFDLGIAQVKYILPGCYSLIWAIWDNVQPQKGRVFQPHRALIGYGFSTLKSGNIGYVTWKKLYFFITIKKTHQKPNINYV